MPIRKRGADDATGEGTSPSPNSSKLPVKKRIIPKGKSSTDSKTSGFKLEGTEIGEIIKQATAAYGPSVIGRASSIVSQKRVRSGILALDIGLGGGWLMSRAVMAVGEKSTGKTTIAMKTAARVQQVYPDAVIGWIDVEHTFDPIWFKKHGGDTDRLIISEPESGEHAVDLADALARSKEVQMLVTDSIAMLVPMKELEASSEDSLPGVHARLIGGFIRKVTNAIIAERHRGHMPLIMHINQFRSKIGVSFGDPRTLPGGKALEFSTAQQVETRNKIVTYEKGENAGEYKWNEHTCVITKNKTGGRVREVQFKMIRNPATGMPEGWIDQVKTILAWGKKFGIVEGQYGIDLIGKKYNSADNWTEYFIEHPVEYDLVQDAIVEALRKEWNIA